jgi:hypothetical protein
MKFFIILYTLTLPHATQTTEILVPFANKTNLLVRHYDCSERGVTQSEVFSINKVPDCKLSPENLEYAEADQVMIYQQLTKFLVKTRSCDISWSSIAYRCGPGDDSQMDRSVRQGHTDSYRVSGNQCKEMIAKGEFRFQVDNDHRQIPIKLNEYTEDVFSWGRPQEQNNYNCHGNGPVTIYFFKTISEEVDLKVEYKTGKIISKEGDTLPCKYSDGSCTATHRESRAFTWDIETKCEVTILYQDQPAKMYRYNDQYFLILNEEISTQRNGGRKKPNPENLEDIVPDMKLEVMTDIYNPHGCGVWKDKWNIDIRKTNIDNIFVSYSRGFNMYTGKPVSQERSWTPDNLPVTGPEKDDNEPLYQRHMGLQPEYADVLEKVKPIPTAARKWLRSQNTTDFSYSPSAHRILSSDYMAHRTIQLIRSSELALIKSQCEIKRQLISTILTLALTNDKNIGFLLTGDRSKFAETKDGGSTLWLYTCEEKTSKLTITDKCYDAIPIVATNGIQKYVDPISRQTFTGLPPIHRSCESSESRLFQLDFTDDTSWVTLHPHPMSATTPQFFEPEMMKRITEFGTYSSAKTGLYSPKTMETFWDNVVLQSHGGNILKEIVTKVWEENFNQKRKGKNTGGQYKLSAITRLNDLDQQITLDSLISDDFFKLGYMTTFGLISYYITQFGTICAAFFGISVIYSVINTAYRLFQVKQIARDGAVCSKTMCNAFCNAVIVEEEITTAVHPTEAAVLLQPYQYCHRPKWLPGQQV